MADNTNQSQVNRRSFLGTTGLGAAAAAMSATTLHAPPVQAAPLLPTIQLGSHKVTRLLAGYNPIAGYSHMTYNLSKSMRAYFTVERTVAFLQHCEAMGINTFQFDLSKKTRQVLDILWDTDTKLQFISLHAERVHDAPLDTLMKYKPFAVVHHGGVTDAQFRAGKAGKVHDFVKKVHDAGALAGVSSHNPTNVQRIMDEGWENDFFMTCFQNISRTKDEMKQEFGFVTVGEPFIEEDRDAMTATMRSIDKPCLGFKILAAGRRCMTKTTVGKAFKYAFKNIKPTDGVIVGMYPVHQDEVKLNVNHTRKHG